MTFRQSFRRSIRRASSVGLSLVALSGVALWGAAQFEGVAVSEEPSPGAGMPSEVMARITPGPQHAEMARYLGKWDVSISMRMPGAPHVEPAKGTCTYSWLIEGRWMMSRMEASFMGAPAVWVHIHGYNNMTLNYETVGFDNMSTDAKFSYGNPVTQDGKTMGFQGFMNEYMNGQIKKPFRVVAVHREADRFHLEIWDPEIGPNGTEVMRMEYTRPGAGK